MPKRNWTCPNANNIKLDFSQAFRVEFISVSSGLLYSCAYNGKHISISTYCYTRPISTLMPLNPSGFQKLFNILAKKDSIKFSHSRFGIIRKRESLPTITTEKEK